MADRLEHNLPEMLCAFGLPRRLLNTQPFGLRSSLHPLEYHNKPITVSRQLSWYTTLCADDPGWLAYICAHGDMTVARIIAANIMYAYWMRDDRVAWLTSFDRVDRVPFAELKLLVVDTLFADSAAYRRDKIYEIINHHANATECSVIVLSNATLDAVIAQLTMRANFALGTKQ